MTFGALILAISLWLFVISNNTYNMIVDMPIEARNLSAQHALNKEVPKVAKVRLKGTGRSLFKSYILKSFFPNFKLVIDLERISRIKNIALSSMITLKDIPKKYQFHQTLMFNMLRLFIRILYRSVLMNIKKKLLMLLLMQIFHQRQDILWWETLK
ncbi:hypothetical protein CM15mP37_07360 [bacterium]|nr:MAG: hypothetical protein CM15mP37_07360 [bacterium]